MPATATNKPHAGRITVVTGAARGTGQAITVGLASKMAVIGFTRALSATLGDDGITVNVVLAALTRTAMSEGLS
jgi:NAD(P)-dependent dehydrogenase (short-subunit alcohol dehydrogenase family)